MSRYTQHDGQYRFIAGIQYQLKQDLVWHIGAVDGPEFVVPSGFIFDVSVPPFLRWLINPHNVAFFKAAALHDRMLINGWSRITAGAEFHNALRADGVPAVTRIVMWLAVSLWKYGT